MSGVRAAYDTQLYNFVPTEWICITFVVLFSLLAIIHISEALHSRLWWLLPTLCTGAFLEILGWSFRLWSSKNPRLLDPFLGNLICLGLGPVFVLAACYLVLGLVINLLGPEYSRLRPRTYLILFSTADVLSLCIQSVGGALASTAAQSKKIPPPDPNKGARIILAGICVQEAFMLVYIALGAEFIYRYSRPLPLPHRSHTTPRRSFSTSDLTTTTIHPIPITLEKSLPATASTTSSPTTLLVSLSLSTILILLRSLYRTAELSQGWTGPIISSERLFNVLDGAAMVCAITVLAVGHPGRVLGTRKGGIELGWRQGREEKV